MERIYKSAEELIGHTPLVELTRVEQAFSLNCRLLAKVDSFNPGGSSKDRVAVEMLNQAEKDGRLLPGGTVIEPTSGNTGIGLALVAGLRGYKVIIVMPDSMSEERKLTIAAYGAQLILTPGQLGMKGCIEKAEQLAQSIPGSIVAGQFVNPANPAAHFKTTGPEIYADTDGQVDCFVCGIGTGGTITGTGTYLKSKNPAVRVVGFEPYNSSVLNGYAPGKHNLQGIGAGFIPEILDTSVIDEVVRVTDEAAYEYGRMLACREGLMAGITSGAALYTAVTVAQRPEMAGKTVVAFLPDSGSRYLTTPLYS